MLGLSLGLFTAGAQLLKWEDGNGSAKPELSSCSNWHFVFCLVWSQLLLKEGTCDLCPCSQSCYLDGFGVRGMLICCSALAWGPSGSDRAFPPLPSQKTLSTSSLQNEIPKKKAKFDAISANGDR